MDVIKWTLSLFIGSLGFFSGETNARARGGTSRGSSYRSSTYRSSSYRSQTNYYDSSLVRYSRYSTYLSPSLYYYSYIYRYYYYSYATYRASHRIPESGSGICKNYEINSNGTYLGIFQCPLPFEPASHSYCCGEANAEYCCRFGDNPGMVTGIVLGGVIVLIVISAQFYCWLKKKGHCKLKRRTVGSRMDVRFQSTQSSTAAQIERAQSHNPHVLPAITAPPTSQPPPYLPPPYSASGSYPTSDPCHANNQPTVGYYVPPPNSDYGSYSSHKTPGNLYESHIKPIETNQSPSS